MDIRVRTAEEFRDAHVTIEIRAADQSEAQKVFDGLSARLYTAEEVGDLQASEAELVAAPLREAIRVLERRVVDHDRDRTTERDRADRNQARAEKAEAEVDRLKKGHVCTRSCKPDAHVAFTGRQRLEELEQEVHDERERADQNEEWAERAELRLSKDAESHLRQMTDLESEKAYWVRGHADREAARAVQEKRADKAEGSLRESRDLVEFKNRVITGLEEDRDKLFGRVQTLTDSLAARVRLLTRATLDLTQMTTQRDQLLSELHGPNGPYAKLIEAQEGIKTLAAQIGKVSGAVHSREVRDALARLEMSEADYVVSLANVVRKVRRIIGSPGPETSPA